MNFVESANWAIQDFVDLPENRVLRCGTGNACTPFRGTLFGEIESAQVAARLQTKRVDIFCVGSNPDAPSSLDAILRGDANSGQIDTFIQQRGSGKYSTYKLDVHGAATPDWDPIHRPARGWTLYAKLFEAIADIKCVAMANFLPWGSKTFADFVDKMAKANPELLHRVLEFCTGLNLQLMRTLNPRLIVVFGRGRFPQELPKGNLALRPFASAFKVPTARKSFVYCLDECPGLADTRILHVPHPASLRFGSEDKRRIIEDIASRIGILGSSA